MKRIYVAGPMTGIRNFNFPAFFAAATLLRSNGFDPINPAEMDVTEGDVTMDTSGTVSLSATWNRDRVMERDLAAVRNSDGVLLLDGWGKSRGALDEVTCAVTSGVPIYRSIANLRLGLALPAAIMRDVVRRRYQALVAGDPMVADDPVVAEDPVVARLFLSEPEELLNTFRQMLSLATSDGAKKRKAGLKPCWKEDDSHAGAFHRHLRRFMEGESVDPDSGADPRIHMAWRLLAWAYVDTDGAAVTRLTGTVDETNGVGQ